MINFLEIKKYFEDDISVIYLTFFQAIIYLSVDIKHFVVGKLLVDLKFYSQRLVNDW